MLSAEMATEVETKYHAHHYRSASDEQLEQWASDPNCIEMAECADTLAKRRARKLAEAQALATRKKELEDNPFDPRTEVSKDTIEVSADAKYIVKHLWIIFVLLPFVLAVAYVIVSALAR